MFLCNSRVLVLTYISLYWCYEHISDAINWTAFEQQFLHSLIMSKPLLSMVFGNADAALWLIPAQGACNPKPYITCTSATLGSLA
jgi:hypothetical protein